MQTRLHRLARTLWLPSLAIVLLLALAGCEASPGANPTGRANSASQSTTSQNVAPQQGLNLHFDESRFEFNSPSLMCKGLLVAEGIVGAQGPSHWNTPTGSRPANLDRLGVIKGGYMIYTPIQFSSLHILIDYRTKQTHEFVTLGGKVGQDQFWIDGFPQLTVSGHYLMLFTPSQMVGVKGYNQDTLIVYNAFPIDAQGMVLLQPKIVEQGQVSQQEVKMPLSQIEQQLATCH